MDEHGRLVVVECKLWRNPQARREVVGQINRPEAGKMMGAEQAARLKRSGTTSPGESPKKLRIFSVRKILCATVCILKGAQLRVFSHDVAEFSVTE